MNVLVLCDILRSQWPSKNKSDKYKTKRSETTSYKALKGKQLCHFLMNSFQLSGRTFNSSVHPLKLSLFYYFFLFFEISQFIIYE